VAWIPNDLYRQTPRSDHSEEIGEIKTAKGESRIHGVSLDIQNQMFHRERPDPRSGWREEHEGVVLDPRVFSLGLAEEGEGRLQVDFVAGCSI